VLTIIWVFSVLILIGTLTVHAVFVYCLCRVYGRGDIYKDSKIVKKKLFIKSLVIYCT